MSNPEKGSSVILDACVLVPIALCDAFLRLAEEPSLYRPLWSEEVLTELRRALVKKPLQLPPCKADYRIACMKAAFPEALVAGYQSLIPTVRIPAAHDKHVVATALHPGAGAICTANTRHFPRRAIAPYGVVVLTPDESLLRALRRNTVWVMDKLRDQARSRGLDLTRLMAILGKAAPEFAQRVQTLRRPSHWVEGQDAALRREMPAPRPPACPA